MSYDTNAVKAAAILFAQTEINGDKAVSDIAKILGDKPSFEAWDAIMGEWKAAYQIERKCTEDAGRKAVERIVARLGAAFALEKPRAENKVAVAKSEKRAEIATAKATFEKANAGKTVSQLFEDSKAALELGNPKLATALNTLAISKGDEKAKAVKAAIQAKAKSVKAAIGKATLMQLEAIERILGISEAKAAHNVAVGVTQETSVLQEALIKAKIAKAAKSKK